MKKLIFALALAATLFTFIGCQKEPVEVPYATVKTNLGNIIANGDCYDPTQIQYIDVTFDQPMNTNIKAFLGWPNAWAAIRGSEWVNNYTFRIYVYLLYNREFKIDWNDESYTGDDYIKEKDYFKSKKGVYTEYYQVRFNTIESPNKATPQAYTIDCDWEASVKLSDNTEYSKDNPNQQLLYQGFNDFLNHEYLRPGDTVTVNYKVSSPYDIRPIKVNVVDSSSVANYWKILTNIETAEGEIPGYPLVPETYEVGQEYSGSLTFEITETMPARLDFQLCAPLGDKLYSVNFLKLN